MRIYKILIFVLLVFTSTIFGQKANENIKGWTKFDAKDKSFQISFPKSPKQIFSKTFTFGGLLDAKQSKRYLYSSNKDKYFVGYKDYPSALIDWLAVKAKYQSMFIFSPEKEVFVDGKPGVQHNEVVSGAEEMFNTYSVNAIYRIFIVKQRLFILAAFIPTKFVNKQEDKSEFEKRANSFFDTFSVLKIPPAKNQPSPLLPMDYNSTLVGQRYQSKLLNLSITIPKDWKTWTYKPKLRKIVEGDGYSGLNSYLSQHKKRSEERLLFANSGYSELWLSVHRREFVTSKAKEIADKVANLFSSEVQTKIIKGRKFQVVENRKLLGESLYTSRRYYTNWNGYIIEFGFGAYDQASIAILEKSVNSLNVLGRQ